MKDHLYLQNPVIVGLSPNRPNIYFFVIPAMKLDELSAVIAGDLIKIKMNYPKTVVLCGKYWDCSNLYVRLL